MDEQSAERRLDDALSRAPSGHKAAMALVDALRGRDDRHVERDYLELKSVEKWDASAFAKIAKFILAAGNRTSVSEHFDGRAVMVLGIDKSGAVSGVPERDDHVIRESIERLLPERSPDWDFIIVRDMTSGQDVVVLHVNPPSEGDRLYVAERDGHDLLDGAVYVRKGSQTRPAKSRELYALLDRGQSSPVVDLRIESDTDIAFAGIADSIGEGILNAKYEQLAGRRRQADAHKDAEKDDPTARMAAFMRQFSGSIAEQLSKPPSWQDIEQWQAEFEEHWVAVKHEWVGLVWPTADLFVVNKSPVFLEDVDIDIRIPAGVFAIDHRDRERSWQLMRAKLPGIAAPSIFPAVPAVWNGFDVYEAKAENRDGGVEVQISLPKLPPETSMLARSSFVLCASDGSAESVTCEWSMTAKGHHVRYRGTTVLSVSRVLDVGQVVRAVIRDTPEGPMWSEGEDSPDWP